MIDDSLTPELILAAMLVLIGLVAWIVRILRSSPLPRPSLEQLRADINGVREHIAAIREDNQLDHETMERMLEKANGRLQFLMAKEIAMELEIEREAKSKPQPMQRTKEPPDDSNSNTGDSL